MPRRHKLRRRRPRRNFRRNGRFKKRVRKVIFSTVESKRIIETLFENLAIIGGTNGTIRAIGFGGSPGVILDQFVQGTSNNTMIGNECYLTGMHGKFNLCFQTGQSVGQENWAAAYPIIPNNTYQWMTRIVMFRLRKGFNVPQAVAFVGVGGALMIPAAPGYNIFDYPQPSTSGTSTYQWHEMFRIVKDKWFIHNMTVGQMADSTDTFFPDIKSLTNQNMKFKWAIKKKQRLNFVKGNPNPVYDIIPNNFNYFIGIWTNVPNTWGYTISGYRIHTFKDP